MEAPDVHSSLLALDAVLDPALLTDESQATIAAGLDDGRLVVLRDAFRGAFADRVHETLDGFADWPLTEGGEDDFYFRHHNMFDRTVFPPDLHWCHEIFSSPASKQLLTRWSGRDCSGTTTVSASWYLPGDYSLPHTDKLFQPEDRQVAFVWHLTRDWQRSWGGHLYWGPTQSSITPSYNTLFLFTIDERRVHCVMPVSPFARGKRLAVNGWWLGPSRDQPREVTRRRRPRAPIEVL